MERRYCDSCGIDNASVRWYYSVETDEIALCRKCKSDYQEYRLDLTPLVGAW